MLQALSLSIVILQSFWFFLKRTGNTDGGTQKFYIIHLLSLKFQACIGEYNINIYYILPTTSFSILNFMTDIKLLLLYKLTLFLILRTVKYYILIIFHSCTVLLDYNRLFSLFDFLTLKILYLSHIKFCIILISNYNN